MAPKKAKGGFYAVRVGRQPGVYLSWADCQAQVKGFSNAQHSKFMNASEAEAYVAGNASSSSATGETASSAWAAIAGTNSIGKGKKRALSPDVEDESGWEVVYSDGACKGNGKVGSIAGVGVWWGPDDPRNIAERCPGDQTNNRAELIAILRVLEETPLTKRPLLIKTDSQYSINCFKQWLPKWIANGWKNVNRDDVKNAGIIRLISAQLDYRAFRRQQVRLQYVKGHSGNTGNDGADAEANKGALLPSIPERDWAQAEKDVREKIEADSKITNLATPLKLEVQDFGDSVEVVQKYSPKRKRILSPIPVSTEVHASLEAKRSPSNARDRTNRLGAIESRLKPSSSSTKASSSSKPLSPSKPRTAAKSLLAEPSSSRALSSQSPPKLVSSANPPLPVPAAHKNTSASPSPTKPAAPSKPTLITPRKAPTSRKTANAASHSSSRGALPTKSTVLVPTTQTSSPTNLPYPSEQAHVRGSLQDPITVSNGTSPSKRATSFKYNASHPLLKSLMPFNVVQPPLIPVRKEDVDISLYSDCILDASALAYELDSD